MREAGPCCLDPIFDEFPTVDQATAFTNDAKFGAAMQRAGVTSAPRIEIFESV